MLKAVYTIELHFDVTKEEIEDIKKLVTKEGETLEQAFVRGMKDNLLGDMTENEIKSIKVEVEGE